MKRLWLIAMTLVLVGLPYGPRAAAGEKEQDQMPEYEGKVNAPEFPDGLEWLNTDRPLFLRRLKGKIVLLDFWTYCCINCMHVIPDLKKLEKKYPNELVVIGVHSAKFNGERDTDNIRQAILRYEIEHPVVNDYAMEIWQQYAVRAWPTLMLIDPAGKIVGGLSGEGVFEPLDEAIAKLIKTFDERKQLDRKPLDLKLESHRVPSSLLAFPGKVLADEKTRQLFISDSNHNRIVVASLDDYAIKEVIGTGEIGIADGGFETATFNHPQGMAFDGRVLYVADTENHAIRRVDFGKRTVETIAGTGEQSREYVRLGGQGRQIKLNSPWDLVLHNGILYIAMAGPHQLWQMNPQTGGIAPFAGTGREALIDGPLDESALAQPSGLTTDGTKLYFADSEVSAIRSADLGPDGAVETIVGKGLFDFGDRDGRGPEVRLQHPLGVVHHEGALYVADTYNNKIKRISPKDRSSETFLGTGKAGLEDGARATFDEPGGVSVAMGKLYIADTNNHVIRVGDLKTKQVETVQFKGMEKLRPRARSVSFRGEAIELPAQTVEPGQATLVVQLDLPAGYKLNPLAPTSVTAASSQAQVVGFQDGAQQAIRSPRFPLSVPVKVGEGETTINVDYSIYYCESVKESLCFIKDVRLTIPVKAKKGAGSDTITASYKLKL
jgi:thiol-disulfide isomerase/thioredoxin/sugar lactone lactonase YvrE